MKTKYLLLCLLGALVVTASCAPAEEPEAAPEAAADAVMADAASSDDPLSGTWSGDWGPTPDHRNVVTLELMWDGTSLTGTVNPGPNAIELSSATFDPATGTVAMAASATNFRGEEVNYSIEGQLEGDSMSGSWNHDGGEGDFAVSR